MDEQHIIYEIKLKILRITRDNNCKNVNVTALEQHNINNNHKFDFAKPQILNLKKKAKHRKLFGAVDIKKYK